MSASKTPTLRASTSKARCARPTGRRMVMLAPVLLAVLGLLAACGVRGDLQPPSAVTEDDGE